MADTEKTIQYLSFHLGDQEYGIAIGEVREISRVLQITPVPRVPVYVLGVMNLRGKVIPVIDLRLRFELPQQPLTTESCVVVVEGKQGEVGVTVDRVNEVLTLKETDIQVPPVLGSEAFLKFVTGMVKRPKALFMLLGVTHILAFQEFRNSPKNEDAA